MQGFAIQNQAEEQSLTGHRKDVEHSAALAKSVVQPKFDNRIPPAVPQNPFRVNPHAFVVKNQADRNRFRNLLNHNIFTLLPFHPKQ